MSGEKEAGRSFTRSIYRFSRLLLYIVIIQRGVSFKDANAPLPDEKVFRKEVNSAFIGTGLEAYLRGENIQNVCITGLSTQHCVSTTARMAGNLGFSTYLVSDACAAFEVKGTGGTVYPPEQVHEIELAMLNKEFAQVVTAGELMGLLV